MKIEHLTFSMNTKLFPIIGCPMSQSSASYAYNPLFAANNIDEIMWPIEVPVGGLGDFVAAFRAFDMKHFILTMPHKAAIIPLLDEVASESRIFNSVNVVKMSEDGRLIGIGMDGKGNMVAIKKAGISVRDMHVFILGAGSIVGAILLQMAKEGARKVTLVNRSIDRAHSLAKIVNQHTNLEIECFPFTKDNLDRVAGECDFFMQSTPLGLFGYDSDHEYLDFMDKLRSDVIVMENIVNPPLTKVAQIARDRGHKVIYGIDMMLGQLAEIFEFCYGFVPAEEHLASAKKSIYEYFKFDI